MADRQADGKVRAEEKAAIRMEKWGGGRREGQYPEAAVANKPGGYWQRPDWGWAAEEEKGILYSENERSRGRKIRKATKTIR